MLVCADCGAPAELIDVYTLASTDGPVTHYTVRCLRRHTLTLRID